MLKAATISRRALLGGALSLGSLAMLAGCSHDGTSDDGVQDTAGTLEMSIAQPRSIDPGRAVESADLQVVYQLFEPLCAFDYATEELVGYAAQSWEVSDDALTFTFHLREASFHSGEAVCAADVKRAWERIVSPSSALAALEGGSSAHAYRLSLVEGYDALRAGTAQELSGVSCPDDRTLVVHLTRAYADFPFVLAHPSLAPVPAAAEEDAEAFGRQPVGNGPYQMEAAWEQGAPAIRLVAYAGYRTGAPAVETLRFQIEQDATSAYRDFLTGEVDVCACPVDEASSAASHYGRAADGLTMGQDGHFVEGTTLACACLVCNTAASPLDRVELRRALSLAIDRDKLCDEVMRGLAQPADGILPPRVPGYRTGAWASATYDASGAAQLLDEVVAALAASTAGEEVDGETTEGAADAGGATDAAAAAEASASTDDVPEDLSVTILYSANGGHDEVLDAIKGDLEAVGVTIVLEGVELDELYDRLASGRFELARLDATTDMPTMDSILYPLFHSESAAARNYTGYASTEVDSLITEARATVDDAGRTARLQQADNIIGQAMPVIPLYYPEQAFAGSDKVLDLVIDPEGYAHVAAASLSE